MIYYIALERMNARLIFADIYLQLGFMLLTVFWKFDFPPFMVLVIAILNDGKSSTILTAVICTCCLRERLFVQVQS